jgi:murein DD-endopeptidase MepM/ murein hydrolase activator NlpD
MARRKFWTPAAIPAFGRRATAEPFSFVVDLAAEPLGAKWCRGAATLALLCSSAFLLAPGIDPFGGSAEARPTGDGEMQMMAFAPLGAGQPAQSTEIGLATPAPPPQFVGGKPRMVTEGSTVRVSGHVSEGLYWSLREAGVEPQTAAEYLRAVNSRIDVGADVAPFDRFDLVFSKNRQALLYAALHRAQGNDVQLVKWAPGGKAGWYDANGGERRSDQMMTPVGGRITSRFGRRVHPIFRFARFHSGIDFGAAWGSPIVAAADGTVVGAGWTGGYGRQVRVAHDGGIMTTYSHMSQIAAAPGTPVRQGQVIGYVGSSGVSTGPHLHFEVRVGGRAVDPLSVRLATRPVMEGRELAAFKARLKQLLAIGERTQHGFSPSPTTT